MSHDLGRLARPHSDRAARGPARTRSRAAGLIAVAALAAPSAASALTPSPPIPTPTPTPSIAITSDLAATATIGSLARGSFPLKGSINYTPKPWYSSTGDGTARIHAFSLGGRARLQSLGLIPVTADINFAGSTEGTIQSAWEVVTPPSTYANVDTLRQAVRVTVPRAYLFGSIQIAGGACQTRRLTTLELKRPAQRLPEDGTTPFTGGFELSALTGCGAFNSLVSPLVAGNKNTLALKIGATKPPVPTPTPTPKPPTPTPTPTITPTVTPTATPVVPTPFPGGASLQQSHTCEYPLVAEQQTGVGFDANIPPSVHQGYGDRSFAFNVVITLDADTIAGLDYVGATSLGGSVTAKLTVTFSEGLQLPLDVPLVIQRADVPKPTGDPAQTFNLIASGQTPPIALAQRGAATFDVKLGSLNLEPRDKTGHPLVLDNSRGTPDSDNNPNTVDVPCWLDAGQPNRLITLQVYGPPSPTAVPSRTPTPIPTPLP